MKSCNQLKLMIEKVRLEIMMDELQIKIFKEKNICDGSPRKIQRYERLLRKVARHYRKIL